MTNANPGWFPDPSNGTRLRWWDGQRWSVHVTANGRTWAEPLVSTTPPSQNAASTRQRRFPTWVWIMAGAVGLCLIFFLAPVVAPIALAVSITALIGFSTGARTWLRLRSRRMALGITAGAAAVFLVSGGVSAAVLAPRDPEPAPEAARFVSVEREDTTSSQPATPTPTPTPTAVVTTREEVVTEAIAYTQKSYEDVERPRGETALAQAGQNGERSLTYLITLTDGVETGRELVSDVVSVQPVDEVTAIGVYDPPPPPPPAASSGSGCDSNYADACVPIASDVDCAGGSGNGPAYFSGVARVVGSDIYDLDRDKDGLACEPY